MSSSKTIRKKASDVGAEKKECENVEVSTSKNKRKKPSDVGAESRKRKLLCQRATAISQEAQESSNEEMKLFFKGLFESNFQDFFGPG